MKMLQRRAKKINRQVKGLQRRLNRRVRSLTGRQSSPPVGTITGLLVFAASCLAGALYLRKESHRLQLSEKFRSGTQDLTRQMQQFQPRQLFEKVQGRLSNLFESAAPEETPKQGSNGHKQAVGAGQQAPIQSMGDV